LAVDARLVDAILEIEQRAWWGAITPDPDAAVVLHTLRQRGFRLGLCSNAPYRAASMHAQLRHLGLSELLDSVTFSSEVGWRKPASQIFTAALAAVESDAPHTVMVGDSAHED